MTKFISALLAIVLTLALAGCGVKENLQKKAGEALAEKILGDAGVDVDLDDDTVVIEGEDGQKITFSEDKWPTTDLAKKIPEYKDGKITSVMETSESVFIMLEEVSEDYFLDYLEEIKEMYPDDPYEVSGDSGITYVGGDGDGLNTMLIYETDYGLSINVSKDEE